MGRTDSAGLLIHVDRSEVFEALTTRDALLTWLAPQGMHARFEQFDMREGGSYRLVLTYDDAADAPGKTSADSDASFVRIVQIIPGELIVQDIDFESDDPAFHGTMRMEWSLRSVSEGTDVQVVARNVPQGIRARDHAEGLTSSLVNLSTYMEP